MSENSSIEWTDATWNPVRGCTKISPGCKHCYAETFAERFRGVAGHPYEQGFDLRLVPEKLTEPLKWASPKTVFVNSMSDLFHDGVPDSYIEQVVHVMEVADWHTYQVLTKRGAAYARCSPGRSHPQPNSATSGGASVWRIASTACRESTNCATPAAVRFLSIEPLLEDLGRIKLAGIDWVIVGGESGWGARPMDPAWVVSIRDQCHAEGVSFFFKQWGGAQSQSTAATWMAAPTMRCRRVVPARYRRGRSAWDLLTS